MAIRKLSTAASRLVDHHRLRGRSYPTAKYWERLYQMLEEEAERRGKTPPPPPMTHALDHEPTDEDKMERHARAGRVGRPQQPAAPRAGDFDRMPTSCWNRIDT